MWRNLRELAASRELIRAFVVRDLRVRYRGSYFGFVLSTLVPIVQVVVLTVAFKHLVRFTERPNYSAYLFCGILAYQVVQYVTLESSTIINKHRDLIKKAYFPREVLPLSSTIGNFIHFSFTMLLFLGFLASIGHLPRVTYLWIPAVMVLQACLSLGLALLFSVLNALMHDIEFLLSHIFMLGFYLSPVLYESSMVKEHVPGLYNVYMANPMATTIETYRAVILSEPMPPTWACVWCAACCVGTLMLGYAVFRRVAWRLPELI